MTATLGQRGLLGERFDGPITGQQFRLMGGPGQPSAGTITNDLSREVAERDAGKPNPSGEIFGDTIYSYTRAQAIEDGTLVDLSKWGREAGVKYPIAITAAAFAECVEITDDLEAAGQSVEGRAWDVVMMFRTAARAGQGDALEFAVSVLADAETGRHENRRLKALCGPGDTAEPGITIMLPEED